MKNIMLVGLLIIGNLILISRNLSVIDFITRDFLFCVLSYFLTDFIFIKKEIKN